MAETGGEWDGVEALYGRHGNGVGGVIEGTKKFNDEARVPAEGEPAAEKAAAVPNLSMVERFANLFRTKKAQNTAIASGNHDQTLSSEQAIDMADRHVNGV